MNRIGKNASFSLLGTDAVKRAVNRMAEWIEADKLPSTTKFLCPYCRETVYYSHGSSSKARKRGLTKRCLYRFCPWCGEPVEPLNKLDLTEHDPAVDGSLEDWTRGEEERFPVKDAQGWDVDTSNPIA